MKCRTAWLWEQEGQALSDVLLRIRPLPSAKGENAEELAAKMNAEGAAEGTSEYHLHSVVLAANSLHFRARLLSGVKMATACPELGLAAAGSAASSSMAPKQQPSSRQEEGMRVLEERLAPADTAAAHSVLRHMYTEELEYESPSALVTVLKIADKWKAADTVDACRVAFSALAPEQIDLEVIKRVYSLEGIVNDVHNFAELLAAVQSRLVTMFRDVVEVVRNPGVQAHFLQLPFAAMLALLRSEQLVVDCENTVVVACNLWMIRGRGRYTTPEQRRFLAAAIRLSALTPSYLCGVLPNLKWYTWPQANPAPFYSTLQARLVSPEARMVLQNNSRALGGGAAVGGTGGGAAAASRSSPSSPRTTNTTSSGSSSNKGVGMGHHAVSNSGDGGHAAPPPPLSPPAPLCAPSMREPAGRVLQQANLELVCDIEYARLARYITDGYTALRAHSSASNTPAGTPPGTPSATSTAAGAATSSGGAAGQSSLQGVQSSGVGAAASGAAAGAAGPFKGIHVHSECSYFRGYMWGVKVVFGYSGNTAAASADGKPPAFTVTPSVFASFPPGEEGVLPLVTPITVSFKCTLEAVGAYGAPYASVTFSGASFMHPGDDNVSSIGIANFFKKVTAPERPDSWKPYLAPGGVLRLKLSVQGASVE